MPPFRYPQSRNAATTPGVNRHQQPLHNQTALLIKSALLFERGVVTVSVPYLLRPTYTPFGVADQGARR